MCDYSLEHYRSRPARVGEQYTTQRFASGSIGFVDPAEKPAEKGKPTAVCIACDSTLLLPDIPEELQKAHNIGATEEVTFCQIEGSSPYRDGVRFKNGAKLTLQQVGPDVSATVLDDLSKPIDEVKKNQEPVQAERAFEDA